MLDSSVNVGKLDPTAKKDQGKKDAAKGGASQQSSASKQILMKQIEEKKKKTGGSSEYSNNSMFNHSFDEKKKALKQADGELELSGNELLKKKGVKVDNAKGIEENMKGMTKEQLKKINDEFEKANKEKGRGGEIDQFIDDVLSNSANSIPGYVPGQRSAKK